MKTLLQEKAEAAENMNWRARRVMRFMDEIGQAAMLEAITDELAALGAAMPGNYQSAAKFQSVMARIAAIKAAIPAS